MQKYIRLLASFDWLIALAVFILLVFGISALYSIGLSSETPDFSNVTRQIAAISMGAILAFFVAMWNYRLLRSYAATLFILSAGMLLAVLFFGVNHRGTKGWFSLGLFDFQPVEIAKIAIVVIIAAILSSRKSRTMHLREFLITALPTFSLVILVMMQPDFGSAALIIGTWLTIILFAGLDRRIIAALAGTGIAAALAGWFIFFQEFQKNRIMAFLQPESDPLGSGYNVTQAKIAIGSGRIFGRGLGFGSQSQLRFLPEAQTDFIFASIAEQLGFMGIVLLLSAFILIFWRIIVLLKKNKDDFTGYLIIGLGALIFIQMTVNIGMNLGMLPVTGLPLPLVSYGGSSMISSMIVFGIIESVALRGR